MWSSKAQAQPKPVQEQSPKDSIPVSTMANKRHSIPTIKKDPAPSANTQRVTIFESVKKLPPIEEQISLPIPAPPPTIIFQHQAQITATLKQAINKMSPPQPKNILQPNRKNTGIHHWHITSHVFRSGLILNRTRRASDSILPLLMKTHKANYRPRTNSVDSTLSQTPFESLIDYVAHHKTDENDSSTELTRIRRSTSDSSDCIRRNKLDDSIFQYEMILRHLKNYEQFMSTYPASSSTTSKQQEQPVDTKVSTTLNETEAKFLAKTSMPNRQTRSLSRNVGRTFSEFIMNDLFPSAPSKEQRCSISHASSQTDSSEPCQELNDQADDAKEIIPSPSVEPKRSNSITNEETKVVLNEFDTMLDNSTQEAILTPNSEINVVVLNPPVASNEAEKLPAQKPLMQRLFEGKKTIYSPANLHMETIRLPEEMMPEYETAKKKCFFDSERPIYVTKMIKVSRRGYTQHVRMLCITTERVYNLTKRDPYPKEGLLFRDILGITCTPYKDGFICIHTREVHEDRGDWLVVVDHPCEFITQLFMILKRDHNDDHFLKFETKFKHCRRCLGEASSSDCWVEACLSDSFRIKKADFESVVILKDLSEDIRIALIPTFVNNQRKCFFKDEKSGTFR